MTLLQTLILAVSFFALGIFYLLSFIEKRAWPLMRDPASARVTDEVVVEIDQTLQSVVHYVPLTMQALMATLFVLLCLQAWQTGWSTLPLVQVAGFTVAMAVGLRQVLKSIGGLKAAGATRDVASVRHESSKVYLVHHGGLALSLFVGVIEIFLAAR